MCKVTNKYVVAVDGSIPGYAEIQNARAVAAQNHDRTGEPQIIYVAVEVTEMARSPISFRAVDGVKEG